jgi:hypothetical protein
LWSGCSNAYSYSYRSRNCSLVESACRRYFIGIGQHSTLFDQPYIVGYADSLCRRSIYKRIP